MGDYGTPKLCLLFGLVLFVGFQMGLCNVSYDRKALLINGQRRILFSGSIHYPRSTPEVQIITHICLFMIVSLVVRQPKVEILEVIHLFF